VRTDDLLKQYPDLAPWRPKIGLQPRLTDAELATPGGLPAGFALTGANAGERQTLPGILTAGPTLAVARPGQIIIAGRQYDGTGSGNRPPRSDCGCCAQPATASPNAPARAWSSRYARASSRSTRPSTPSSTSTATAATPRPA
jgi:hypothetical protein